MKLPRRVRLPVLFIPLIVLVATLCLGGCPPPAPDPETAAPGPAALVGTASGARTQALVTVEHGGIVTLETASRVYVLDVAAEALDADTEITLEEISLVALPGTSALRMSPDGLQFRMPAVLSIDSGAREGAVLVGLAFTEGVPGAEASFGVPDGAGGASVLVRHFSAAAITDAESATIALDDEQDAVIAGIESVAEGAAIGLQERFAARVAPDIARANLGVVPFADATRVFQRFRADVQATGTGGLTGGGPALLDEVVDGAFSTLRAQGLELLTQRTAPACTKGRDVFDLSDFVSVVRRIEAIFQQLGIAIPDFTLCVASELSVTASPTALTSETDTITIEGALELVAIDGTREPIGPSAIFFDVTGATGPDNVTTDSGAIPATAFVRPSARPRPAAVRIVVTGESRDTQLEVLPAPTPIVVTLAEPVEGELTTSLDELAAPGTVEVCARARVSGQPVDRFAVEWSLGAPVGALGASRSLTTTGEACVTWTSPASLPDVAADVPIVGLFNIDGAVATASTSIHINARPRGLVTFVRTETVDTSLEGCIPGAGLLEITVALEISLTGQVELVAGTYHEDGSTDGSPDVGSCAIIFVADGTPLLERPTPPFRARLSEPAPPFGSLSLPVVFTSTATRSGAEVCAGVETLVDETVIISLPYTRTAEGHYDFTRDDSTSTICLSTRFVQTGVVVPR